MTILYALVARGTTVLAEFTSTSGNFPTITRVLLGKIPEEDGKMSYVYDQFVFHYVVENKITFLCMADEDAKRRVPFAFLDDIKVRERVVARRRRSLHSSLSRGVSTTVTRARRRPRRHRRRRSSSASPRARRATFHRRHRARGDACRARGCAGE